MADLSKRINKVLAVETQTQSGFTEITLRARIFYPGYASSAGNSASPESIPAELREYLKEWL